MSEGRGEMSLARDEVATMMRAAGLPVETDRLDAIAELLEAAVDAADQLDEAAGRIPLAEALSVFDPAWQAGDQ